MDNNVIYGIIPCYGENGENGTTIIFKDGTSEFYSFSTHHYMEELVMCYNLNPKRLSWWSSTVVGGKLNIPIVIKKDIIFVPIKVRHAVGKQDGCFGYVLSTSIDHIYKDTVILTNGVPIHTLSSISYIKGKIKDAILLNYAYLNYMAPNEFMRLCKAPFLNCFN